MSWFRLNLDTPYGLKMFNMCFVPNRDKDWPTLSSKTKTSTGITGLLSLVAYSFGKKAHGFPSHLTEEAKTPVFQHYFSFHSLQNKSNRGKVS